MRLKLTQSPTKVGVEVGTELGNYERILLVVKKILRKSCENYERIS